MKKFALILGIMLLFNTTTYASQYTPALGKIESTLYGFQYENENDEIRLDRIEQTVYGNINSGNINTRLAKLKNDLAADLMGQEISPKEDTFADESDTWIEQEPMANSNIQYPAVDELELNVFNQKYPSKDIKQRLAALEVKTFGKNYDDDLASRVDRLKAEIKPMSFMDNQIAQSDNVFFDDEIVQLDKTYHLDRYESPNQFDYDAYNARNNKNIFPIKKANITTVENSILRRSFQNDTMENRLTRLENAMFGTEFANDDTQTRVNRISSAYKAQKNATKYDSNKFSQNMATAMQIGTMILMVLACIL